MNEIYPWQKQQWQGVIDSIKLNRLPHALLLSGTKNLGKFDFAFHLAEELLCDDTPNCQNLLTSGTHPDLWIIGLSLKSKVIKTEDFRAFLNKTKLTPMMATQKVAIIQCADKMTTQTANSFLKILEEPFGDTIFILLDNLEKPILTTIKSRCQRIIFSEPTIEQFNLWLDADSTCDTKTLLTICNFAPLVAKNIVGDELKQHYLTILNQLNSIKKSEVFKISTSWMTIDYFTIISWWQNLIFELLKQQKIQNYQTSIPIDNLIVNATEQQLLMFYDKLLSTKIAFHGATNVRLLLDDLLLSWVKIK